jgi:AAA-like domain/TIR domain
MTVKVCLLYSRRDDELFQEFCTHLNGLQNKGMIDLWSDREIMAGAERSREIKKNLEQAELVLLLVSADFLEFCCDSPEMNLLLTRHQSQTVQVIPVIIRACDWTGSALGQWQVVPRDNRSVANKGDKFARDALWLEIVQEIERVVLEIRKPPTPNIPPPADVHFPNGVVPVDSPFYIENERIISQCKRAIIQPSGLLRIQAPYKMGKTSLLERLIVYAKSINYRVVRVDLRLFNGQTDERLDVFLRWLCDQFNIQGNLALGNFIEAKFTSANDNCTNFIEQHILGAERPPILFCIDNLDSIYPYSFSRDFLSLLRSWHEKQDAQWPSFRIILLHVWHLKINDNNRSPFNVGEVVRLPELELAQVQDLIKIYGLELRDQNITDLMNLVGGHPFLLRLALYQVSQNRILTQDTLFFIINQEVYYDHLVWYSTYLNREPQLRNLMREIVHANQPILRKSLFSERFENSDLIKLKDLGLIKVNISDSSVEVANQLYKSYFREQM